MATSAVSESPRSLDSIGSAPTSARRILEAAFENYYGCDFTAEVEIVIRSRGGAERRRILDAAVRRIGGRRRGLAQVRSPAYLRGMTFLTIENGDGSSEGFIYLPSQRRVRRVTTAQRGEAFLGSDLTHEDMQRRYASDYDVQLLAPESVDDEPAHVVLARPRGRESYDRLHVLVARADSAFLGLRYFKRDSDAPYRTIAMPRRFMHTEDGHVLPARIEVDGVSRGSATTVVFRDLAIDPELPERLFHPSWLERPGSVRSSIRR